MNAIPRHIIHIRDRYANAEDPVGFVATELFLDGRRMLLAEEGPTIEMPSNELTVVHLPVLATVVRFTGPDVPPQYRDLHDALLRAGKL